MPRMLLASQLARWLPPDPARPEGTVQLEVGGDTVGAALESLFATHPNLRGYVLDEHGGVRHHVAIFVDGRSIRRKDRLDDPLGADAEIHVLQALSGG
jgi:molybdopterin synthase sulfur carrier subunit